MSADPQAPRRTITVPGNGTGTLSFALPPGLTFDVQSLFALVDASGAGATAATLTIADSSGEVIARKRQGETIDAGTNPGSATWALRLADSGGGTLKTTQGVTVVDPTTELRINGNMALTNLGAGVAQLAATSLAGTVTGWLYASVARGANKFQALAAPNYGPLWGGGTQEAHGTMAGITMQAGAGPPAFSRVTLPAGAYLIWYATWTDKLGFPRLTWTFVSAHEVGYLLDTQEINATGGLGAGACVRFAKLTGNKTLTTQWSSPAFANPNADGQAYIVIIRLSL